MLPTSRSLLLSSTSVVVRQHWRVTSRCLRSLAFTSPTSTSLITSLRFDNVNHHQISPYITNQHTRLFSSSSSAPPSSSTPPPLSQVKPTFSTFAPPLHPLLQTRLKLLNITTPTPAQVKSYTKLSSSSSSSLGEGEGEVKDTVIASQTGSGKTISYLLPLINTIITQKTLHTTTHKVLNSRYKTSVIILVPNKELAQQVLKVALVLSGGFGRCVWGGDSDTEREVNAIFKNANDEDDKDDSVFCNIAVLPGGLRTPTDFKPWRHASSTMLHSDFTSSNSYADIVIATPITLAQIASDITNLELIEGVDTLVIDECDMLLDGGYLKPLEAILMGFRRKERKGTYDNHIVRSQGLSMGRRTKHAFVGATIPSFGLKSVDSYIKKRYPNAEFLEIDGVHKARHEGLSVGTEWVEISSDNDRYKRLKTLLSEDMNVREKTMVFVNTTDAVDLLVTGLRKDGFDVIGYHANLQKQERADNLARFRNADDNDDSSDSSNPIMICTDLASRGLDIPNVTLVIQAQFASNVVSHLHRLGRCGRGFNSGVIAGRGVVFYGREEGELVEVVRKAEREMEDLRGRMVSNVEDSDEEEGEEGEGGGGKVTDAFSRKRGFRRKTKKEKDGTRGPVSSSGRETRGRRERRSSNSD